MDALLPYNPYLVQFGRHRWEVQAHAERDWPELVADLYARLMHALRRRPLDHVELVFGDGTIVRVAQSGSAESAAPDRGRLTISRAAVAEERRWNGA